MLRHLSFYQSVCAASLCFLLAGTACFESRTDAWEVRVIDLAARFGQKSERHHYTILGAVQQPACYQFKNEKLALSELIDQAGGLNDRAGQKVSIVRGGRAGIVLLYSPGTDFELQSGDIVRFEPQKRSTMRTVSYQQLQQQGAAENSHNIVHRAQYEHPVPAERGQVVLLGLKDTPVVMPLWKEGLTADSLFTQHLKQDPALAAQTTLVAGPRLNGPVDLLQDGMILQVPAHLVNQKNLPRLPEVLDAVDKPESPGTPEVAAAPASPSASALPLMMENSAAIPGSVLPQTDAATINPLQGTELTPIPAPETETQPSNSRVVHPRAELPHSTTEPLPFSAARSEPKSVPSLEMPLKSAEPLENGLRPFEDMLAQTIQKNPPAHLSGDYLALLDESAELVPTETKPPEPIREPVHMALAGESVPAPRELSQAKPISFVGWIAGGIVLFGVGTVVFSALKNQWLGTSTSRDEQPAQSAPFAEHRVPPRQQPSPAPVEPISRPVLIEPLSQKSTPPVEAESITPSVMHTPEIMTPSPPDQPEVCFPAEEITPTPSLLELTCLPIREEQVVLPRELKFFGRPHLHYVFRIDARHEIPKPHIVPSGRQKQADRVPATGEQSLFTPTKDTPTSTPVESDEHNTCSMPLETSPEPGTGLFGQAYALARRQQSSPS